jgi:predicted ArsR family transcriptional regulator
MNLRLLLIKAYIPEFIRKKILVHLFKRTAAAFDVPVPPLPANCADLLQAYARFTRQQAANVDAERKKSTLNQRLFEQMQQLGTSCRKRLRLQTEKQAVEALQIIYRLINIELKTTQDDVLRIEKCFFSDFYSPETCKLISAMDRGMVSGLTNGLHLEFEERLTEGNSCCLARIHKKETT